MTTPHSTTGQNTRSDLLELLDSGLGRIGLDLDAEQKTQLLGHLDLLGKWNRKLNLTAIVSPEQMVLQHVLDSLSIHNQVVGRRLLDIGSGGGFPGIPLAIANPDREVVLLDSRGKRIEFLRHACAMLGVDNAGAVKSRIEDYRPMVKFDTLVTRAFSSLEQMLALTKSLQHPGATLLAMKGRQPAAEIAALSAEWQRCVSSRRLQVPFLDAERQLFQECPARFTGNRREGEVGIHNGLKVVVF